MRTIFHWFWTPVREGENSAQTLVRVAGNLLRSVATLVALAALAIVASVQVQSLSQQRISDQRAGIITTVNTDPQNRFYDCTPQFPISIAVMNNSELTLMSMDIELSARIRGSSTNILPYSDRTVRWDQIVPPQHALAMCYRLRDYQSDANHIITAEPRSYSIELRQTEEWMLSETRAFALGLPPCKDGEPTCEPWERNWETTSSVDRTQMEERVVPSQ